MSARPRPPAGLGRRGARFWRAAVAAFELRVDELLILERAGRLLDRLERLDAAAASAPVVDVGSKDQVRVHPAIVELRQHELALAALLRQLGFQDADEGVGADAGSRSVAARSLALARWQR